MKTKNITGHKEAAEKQDTKPAMIKLSTKVENAGFHISGMGSDGSLGLKAIEENNGIAFVQYPDTAQLEGMQRSALESVIPDIVAPAGELPANLIASPKFMPTHMADKSGESKNKSDVEKFIVLLREQNGHGFSLYKKNTLFRLIGNTETMQGMNMVKYSHIPTIPEHEKLPDGTDKYITADRQKELELELKQTYEDIQWFTKPGTQIFKLRYSNAGRPFTDHVTKLKYPKINAHTRQIIKSFMFIETSISTNNKRWFKVKIMPDGTLTTVSMDWLSHLSTKLA